MRTMPVLVLLASCGSGQRSMELPGDSGDTGDVEHVGGPSDTVYDASRVLEVELDLTADDWEALRNEDRNIYQVLTGDCLAEPFDSPYGWYRADIVIDGEALDGIGVRKKGLVGSVVSDRPSLKLDFDHFDDTTTFRGLEHLTLNNQRQDPSRLVTCLAYDRFLAAGLPAPRCSLAHVVVNGEDLGVYANVEPVKKDFLRRHFGSTDGHLYEGTLSDFRDGWTGTFQPDTDLTEAGDRSDLIAVVDALEAGARDPDVLLDALDATVDLDQFFSFWAMEVLVGHWDGYAGNTNNFFVYAPEPGDPEGGRFRFLPWGLDAGFKGDPPFGQGMPTSVVAVSALPAALYASDEGRDRYFEALDSHLDVVWDEDELLTTLDGLADLALARQDNGEMEATIESVGDWIRARRGMIEDELAAGRPEWKESLREEPCLDDIGTLSLTFSTTWGSVDTMNPFTTGAGAWTLELSGVGYDVEFLGAVAGESEGQGVLLVTGQLSNGANLGVYALLDPDLVVGGADLAIDWSEVTAYLVYDEDGDFEDFAIAAYLGDGALRFGAAGTGDGDLVEGRIDVEVWGG